METIREIIKTNCKRLLAKKNRRVNLAEIARQAGVSTTTLQRWQRGENAPEMENIDGLAAALGVKPSVLFMSEKGSPIIKPSSALKMYFKLPDKLVELAQALDDNDLFWDVVINELEEEVKTRQAQEKT